MSTNLAVASLAAAATLVGVGVVQDVTEPGPAAVPAIQDLQPGQYLGPCSVVTPPTPDPCDAVATGLAPGMWSGFINATTTKNWIKGSPKDWARLQAFAAAPSTSAPAMSTFLGQWAVYILQMRAYVPGGLVGGTFPAPNPPLDPNRADKTPPSAPSNLQIVPPTG